MKKITRWIELIFIFGIPLLLLILCMQFKTINTYDENNNVISSEKVLDIKELDFINSEVKTYYNYTYYNTNDIILLNPNETIMINYNKNTTFHILSIDNVTNYYYIYYSYNNLNYYLDLETQATSRLLTMDIIYNESNFTIIRNSSNPTQVVCDTGNVIKSIETKTIQENTISKVLNIMYDSLGINNNIIIQLIVIYTLLWIIMFIIWHIFYLPFNKLLHLFEKE